MAGVEGAEAGPGAEGGVVLRPVRLEPLRGRPAEVEPGSAEGVEGRVVASEPLGDGEAEEERGAQQQPHLAVGATVGAG